MQFNANLVMIVLPLIISFVITAVSGKFLIPALRRLKATQTERDDGPASHLKKTGTPNMGGLMFILGFVVTGLLFSIREPEILPVIFLTVGFGLVGFIDDFIKNVLHRSMGLRAWQKMGLQILIVLLFAAYIRHFCNISLAMNVPFMNVTLHFGVFNIPIMLFIMVATVNGTNLTDGVDGLLSCVTTAVALFFMIAAAAAGSGTVCAAAAMIGGLLGFLLYNSYPARVFMGDTGSLAIGGFVVGMAYMLQMPLFIPIVGFIYMIEVISVIIQVTYFKRTHGKRFFRMAPLHHHYEKGGYSEVQVVTGFTVITVILCTIALLGI